MTLDDLRALLASGEFHHATYRDHGTLWEGLYIYRCDPTGFRGFTLVDSFNVGPREYSSYADKKALADQAHALVRHTGTSVGSYGQG